MKLMRLGPVGAERPVVRIDDTTYVDVSDAVTDYDEAFFGSGGPDTLRTLVVERTANGQVRPFGDERVGAPIARPNQILCIGLNYSDHAAETGQTVPDEQKEFPLSGSLFLARPGCTGLATHPWSGNLTPQETP